MKTLPDPHGLDENGDYIEQPDDAPATESVDWKANPGDVLEAIDRLLEEHGLEILNYDTGADCYAFAVVKRT